jgi:hypothetical protein
MVDFAQFDGFDEEVDEFAMDDKASAKAERMAEAAAIRAAFVAQSKLGVSTDTHTVKEVAAHFLIWRKLKGVKTPVAIPETEENLKKYAKPHDVKVPRIAARKVASKVSLKSQSFSMFENGVDVKTVAAELAITYANAHYYFRTFKKSAVAC